MKTHINLLPPSLRSAKKFRKRIKFFLLAQLGIFLLLGVAVIFLNSAAGEVWRQSRELSGKVLAIAPDAAEAAHAQAAREMLEEVLPVAFDGDRLEYILRIPDGTALSRIDYNAGEILITARTSDINIIETHRSSIAQIFTYVSIGRISGDAEGYYTYEIRIASTY